MKKLFLFLFLSVPFVAMSQANGGYTASYSSKFTIASPTYSDKILTLWKDFENNTLDAHADFFADTVTMMLSNGAVIKGKAENLKGAKEFRGSLQNYKVKLHAWLSLKSDKNENIVCVWGSEEYADKTGKQVKTGVHEVWVFNKDGKIGLMMQFASVEGSM
jgi:hypothetical protein